MPSMRLMPRNYYRYNIRLEQQKDGEDQLDRSCEILKSIAQSQGERNILHAVQRRKANWIGHVLCRNCLLRQIIEGKIEGKIKVMGRRGRRRKQLLEDFNRLTPDDLYMTRTALLTSKRCILYVYSTNICTEYFKHALHSPFLPLQNAVCFIMLTCLVPVLVTFYIQNVLKLKK